MDDLKPCPFCGSEDVCETYSQEYALGTKNPEIRCNTCKAIFSIEDDSPYMNCEEDYIYRKAKTKEAWNRRKGGQKTGKWIKMSDADGTYYCCSECGEDLYREWTFDAQFDLFPRRTSIAKTKYCPNCGAKMEV